jgi:lysophospholipase L1-like esterase
MEARDGGNEFPRARGDATARYDRAARCRACRSDSRGIAGRDAKMTSRDSSPAPRRSRRIGAKLLLALGGTLASLALAEVVTRIAGGGGAMVSRAMFFAFDPDAGWRCRPNLDLRFVEPGLYDVRVRCNSQGLRDREHATRKPAGARRLLCVGDSYVWGQGVEDEQTVASRLGRELQGIETINLGVAGYSAVQELVRLETDGLSYQPDWTVVFFCDNDLDSNFETKDGRRPLVELRGDDALHVVNRPVSEPWLQPISTWIHERSRLLVEFEYCTGLVRERLALRRAAARAAADANAPVAAATTANRAKPRPGPVRAEEIQFSLVDRFLEPDARMDQAWRTLQQIYARMRDLATERGSRLLVVYVPDPPLAVESLYRGLLAHAGLAESQADWNRPGRRLAELCGAIGVPELDLAPAFRAAPDPARLFLSPDPHWSAVGNEIAAASVAQKLRELDPQLPPKR